MFMSIALEWHQPLEYVLERPDMIPVWDIIDMRLPDDKYGPDKSLPTREEREKQLHLHRLAQSKLNQEMEEKKKDGAD